MSSAVKSTTTIAAEAARGRVRFGIVGMLFAVTMVNYADRATLAIAGPAMSKDLGINALQMGFVFSAFGWSYVLGQLPGGWLLDRFGSRIVYFGSIVVWSVFTMLQGGVGVFGLATAVYALFALRFLVGFAEAPSFPANARIVAAWYPANERGTASAVFNSAQYFATVVFAPVMGWITYTYGWPSVFAFMGMLGILVALVWLKTVYAPRQHPRLRPAELDYIAAGGALVDLDGPAANCRPVRAAAPGPAVKPGQLKQLLANRMMLGIFLGQFCINALTYFFITWFPVYLVQQRHMSILNAGLVAAIPAICGFTGGVLGGVWSDALLRRGFSLTAARKTPIVAGMALSLVMVGCNYVEAQWIVVALMALSFFGKGVGALGWAVLSDTAPREIAGLSGGLFNMFGNISSITTPIVIGAIVQATGSFDGALVFVGANALLAVLSFLVIVPDIKRVELRPATA
ncbi:MFS transporter [Lichenibacterium minor]|uniref:MFS transporter n=1 Tax=Lichenibacterium minor TaxID=2316528 RepID=A0A4Q2U2W8_9HYPH|nr:MFS transporter [Lichenibacterium minor]RYC30078.1 MFS transporter [Lichenibacterium minor]